MTNKPKSYTKAKKDAKKSEATNLEAKFKQGKPKEPWPFSIDPKKTKPK